MLNGDWLRIEVKNRKFARFFLRATYLLVHLFTGVALILILFETLKSLSDDYTITAMNTVFSSIFTTIWCSWGWDRMKLIKYKTHTKDLLHELCSNTLTWATILLVLGVAAFALEIQNGKIHFSWEWVIYSSLKDNILFSLATLFVGRFILLGLPVTAGLEATKE